MSEVDGCVRQCTAGDIGLFLKDAINSHFSNQGIELNLKYIDPGYLIRSVPANPFDSVYSLRLTRNAVHAAMCGRTEMVVGRWHGRFVHVPIPLAIRERNQVDPNGDLWMSVLESTGQPPSFSSAKPCTANRCLSSPAARNLSAAARLAFLSDRAAACLTLSM